MKFPFLSEMQTSRDVVDAFGGYNHNLRIGNGEFYDMKNLTSTHYPVLSPRDKRGTYASGSPKAMIAKDSLCYLDDLKLVINEYRMDIGLMPYERATLVSMGAYVVILTYDEHGNNVDSKWVNTADFTDYGDINADFSTTAGTTVTFELAKLNGETYSGVISSPNEPTSPDNMDLWVDTSSVPNTLKQYSSSASMWVSIATTYVRINATGIGKAFSRYDGVTISGIEADALSDLNSSTVIWEKGDDYIVVTGILSETLTQTAPITVTRKMPLVDYVIESENRLWACRYGVSRDGEVVNEIYASKLGDFKNWNCFMGLSTDSYAVSLGTDGPFTGAITHLGYPLFFKENCIHKVYGNYPANYQMQTTTGRGVQKGSERSLAIVNEVLYYKSRTAVCAYDGSLPQEISAALGQEAYSAAVAGGHGNKYYISMKDSGGIYHLFAYDTSKGMWHKEDNTRALQFCSCRGELYYIEGDSIKTMFGSGTPDTEPIQWMAESGVIGTETPDKKYISRLNIRLSLSLGTRIMFFAQYDSSGEWESLAVLNGTSLRTFTLPVKPKRCDHFRLRIMGMGEAKIYSICKTIERGSDI